MARDVRQPLRAVGEPLRTVQVGGRKIFGKTMLSPARDAFVVVFWKVGRCKISYRIGKKSASVGTREMHPKV
jgi:hypothetical protein